MKYIVETLQAFRHVHIVEAENEKEALAIASVADDNWQEYLGQMKIDCSVYTEEQMNFFRKKEFFWDGVCIKDADGFVAYIHPSGDLVDNKYTRVPD
jgi:hypothetical protein